jgi:hypothetical protein
MIQMETSLFEALKAAVLILLTEAYAGPPNPRETWFIDNEPDSGILGAIRHLAAAQASVSVDGSGKRGSTVAANVEHLRWSLANANGALRGQPYNPDWASSWNIITVDDAAWEKLCKDLSAEFEALREAIGIQTELPGEFFTGVLAMAPHAAFHLGLIRQMIERVKSG